MKSFKKNNICVYGILFMVVLFGFYLRSNGIFTNSFAFTYDVGRDLLAVRDLVINHKISLIGFTTGKEGIFYGPIWYWILVIPFLFSSGDPQKIALFMALSGTLIILIGFLIGKKMGGNFFGIIFATLLSFSPVMIGTSSQIWNPNLAPFFVIVLLYVLMRNDFNTKKTFFFIGILLGIILELEIVFGLLLIISIGIYVFFLSRTAGILKKFFAFILGIISILSPKIIFDVRHNFLMTRSFLTLFGGPSSEKLSLSFFSNIPQRIQILINLFSDSLTNSNNRLGILLFLCCFFICIYYSKKLSKNHKILLRVVFVTLVTYVIGLSFFSHDIWPHYLIGLPIFFILFVTTAIDIVNDNYIVKILSVFIVLCISIINTNPIQVWNDIKKPVWEGNVAVYRNQLAVINYIYQDSKKLGFNYNAYTPHIYDYT